MFDPTGIGAALTSAKAILDLIKNANDAQLAMKISGEVANLQGRLVDIQQQALTLQSENQDLRDQIRRAENLDNISKTLRFDGKVYWKTDEPDHPFCPICWDQAKQLVHLSKWNEPAFYSGVRKAEYRCHVHKISFHVPTDK